MSSTAFEYKSLAVITATGYVLNLVFGFAGFFSPEISYQQLLFFQLGDASAIAASVIAARYTGLRGQHVAASAFILLGITHGLSLASSGLDTFHIEKGITLIMPMIPSMILLCWCSMFPVWLRVAGFVPMALFVFLYIWVVNGNEYYSRPLRLAYLSWMIVEILWSVYIVRDWKQQPDSEYK